VFVRGSRVRRSILLVAGVFLSGAAIGAVIMALVHRGGAGRRVMVERTITRDREVSTTPTRASATAGAPRETAGPTTDGPRDGGSEVSFRALSGRLAGQAGVAIAPLAAGRIQTFGTLQAAHAWSTSKVPVLVTLMRDDEASGRALQSPEATDAALALEESDNGAIEALFERLEQNRGGLIGASGAVQQTLRRAGDAQTVINTTPNDQGFTTYGQTDWSLSGEVTFYRALARGCLLDSADTTYVLHLMRGVTASQRWGVGTAGYASSTPLAFKGGWGPDDQGKYQVRQTAIVGAGSRGYVVSMLAVPASGSFADGTAMITALAGWVRRQFDPVASGPSAPCVAAR
jgi:hypothetical protein